MDNIINDKSKNNFKSLLEIRVKKVELLSGILSFDDSFLVNISDELKTEINRLNNDVVFTLGIIGQMKAGKSSLLDTIYFEGKEVLPSAPTPLTAVLTLLKYSSEKKYIVHYYSENEILNIKKDYESYKNNPSGSDAIKGHYQLYQKIISNNLDINMLVNKASEEISANELSEYITSKGKITPMVKEVEMFLDDERVKDVFIVDTPGLNDPITSREIKTKRFMKLADAVIFVSQASQFMDKYDLNSLKQIKELGIKNVIYVMSRFDEAIYREANTDDFRDINTLKNKLELGGKSKLGEKISTFYAIPLMLKLYYKIKRNDKIFDTENFYMKQMEEYICDRENFKEYSGIPLLEKEINRQLDNKNIILFEKFDQHLKQIDNRLNEFIKERISHYEKEIHLLNLSDEDFEKEKEALKDVTNEVHDIMEGLSISLSEKLGIMITENYNDLMSKYKYFLDDLNVKGILNKSDIYSIVHNFMINMDDILQLEIPSKCGDKFEYYMILSYVKSVFNDAKNTSTLISEYLENEIIRKIAEHLSLKINIYFEDIKNKSINEFNLSEVTSILDDCIIHVSDKERREIDKSVSKIKINIGNIYKQADAKGFIKNVFNNIKNENIIYNQIDQKKAELDKAFFEKDKHIEEIKSIINSLINIIKN